LIDIADITVQNTAMGNVFSVTFTSSDGTTRTYERERARNVILPGMYNIFNSQRFTIIRNHGSAQTASFDTAALPTVEDLFPYYSALEINEMAAAGQVQLDTITDAAIEAMNAGGATFTVTNYGFGHNVGMSQWGAFGLANAGYTAAQIIHFYYTGVTISGQSAPPPPPTGNFVDVPTNAWFHRVVQYVREHGLMQGTSTTTFSPETYTTRGQFVTILGRMAGIDPASYAPTGTISGSTVNVRSGPGTWTSVVTTLSQGTSVAIIGRSGDWFRIRTGGQTGYVLGSLLAVQQGRYNDVSAGAFYAPYVEWASNRNIVEGMGDGRFSPAQTVSRQEMATMLYRYINAMGIHLSQNNAPAFNDINAVATWARPAVTALQRAGVIQGMGNNNFVPTGNSNRASVASMIANFHERFG